MKNILNIQYLPYLIKLKFIKNEGSYDDLLIKGDGLINIFQTMPNLSYY
jgi:hypothetical protein